MKNDYYDEKGNLKNGMWELKVIGFDEHPLVKKEIFAYRPKEFKINNVYKIKQTGELFLLLYFEYDKKIDQWPDIINAKIKKAIGIYENNIGLEECPIIPSRLSMQSLDRKELERLQILSNNWRLLNQNKVELKEYNEAIKNNIPFINPFTKTLYTIIYKLCINSKGELKARYEYSPIIDPELLRKQLKLGNNLLVQQGSFKLKILGDKDVSFIYKPEIVLHNRKVDYIGFIFNPIYQKISKDIKILIEYLLFNDAHYTNHLNNIPDYFRNMNVNIPYDPEIIKVTIINKSKNNKEMKSLNIFAKDSKKEQIEKIEKSLSFIEKMTDLAVKLSNISEMKPSLISLGKLINECVVALEGEMITNGVDANLSKSTESSLDAKKAETKIEAKVEQKQEQKSGEGKMLFDQKSKNEPARTQKQPVSTATTQKPAGKEQKIVPSKEEKKVDKIADIKSTTKEETKTVAKDTNVEATKVLRDQIESLYQQNKDIQDGDKKFEGKDVEFTPDDREFLCELVKETYPADSDIVADDASIKMLVDTYINECKKEHKEEAITNFKNKEDFSNIIDEVNKDFEKKSEEESTKESEKVETPTEEEPKETESAPETEPIESPAEKESEENLEKEEPTSPEETPEEKKENDDTKLPEHTKVMKGSDFAPKLVFDKSKSKEDHKKVIQDYFTAKYADGNLPSEGTFVTEVLDAVKEERNRVFGINSIEGQNQVGQNSYVKAAAGTLYTAISAVMKKAS